MDEIIFKVAEAETERAEYFAVRQAIFVEEQAMFHGTDEDEHDADPRTIHLVAINAATGAVVGAVRCYTVGNDVWYGGRLAVLPEYRHHPAAIGPNLCRLAEASVLERGCRRFLAYIQMQNVRFFERLNWSAVGEPVDYHGQLHQLMAASLTVTHFEPYRMGINQLVHA